MRSAVTAWMLLVVNACAGATAGPRSPASGASRAASPPGPTSDPAPIRLDCQQDAECGMAGKVCHAWVLGGTCAPPCDSDEPCAGISPDLRCSEHRCTPAR